MDGVGGATRIHRIDGEAKRRREAIAENIESKFEPENGNECAIASGGVDGKELGIDFHI